MTTLPTIHILFENADWLPPLTTALEKEGFTDIELIQLSEGSIDPDTVPPEGIWINRVSPSSHTRGNELTVQLAREVLFWLELNGRRVINGLRAFEFEMSKFRQDLVLRKYGIKTPKTILIAGRTNLIQAARRFEGPFITKHNQGGKGLGIQLFNSTAEFEEYLDTNQLDDGPDGKIILQQYIEPADKTITRVELVGDRFLFAMKSSTADGFELCPSDVCQLKSQQKKNPDVCPIDGGSKFSPSLLSKDDILVQQYRRLMRNEGIDLAGIEYVQDNNGIRYTYDINGTTNYNSVLGEQIGIDGMLQLAKYIKRTVVPQIEEQRNLVCASK